MGDDILDGNDNAFHKVDTNERKNKPRNLRGSLETVTSDRRRKFRDLGELSVLLPKHKKKYRKNRPLILK